MEKEIKLMIPNRIILNKKNDGYILSSIMHKSKKRNLVFLHYTLMSLRNKWNNDIHTTLNLILDFMGISKRKENVDKLKQDIITLHQNNMLDLNIESFNKLKSNDTLSFEYYPFELSQDGIPMKYFTVNLSTIEKIISLDNNRTHNMLNTYCYLSARSYTLSNNKAYNLFGEYEVCMPSYKAMIDELLIKRNTITSTIRKLMLHDFIYYDNAGKYSFDNKIKQSVNTYILTDKFEYKTQVKESIKYYKSKTSQDRNWNWID